MSRCVRLLSAAPLLLAALTLVVTHPELGHASPTRLQPVARHAQLPPCHGAPTPGRTGRDSVDGNLSVSVPELPGLNCRPVGPHH